MRLLNKVNSEVMYEAEMASEKQLSCEFGLGKEDYCKAMDLLPSVGFEVDGRCVGGLVLNGQKLHLSVLPEYHGRWGQLFSPAFKWAFAQNDPLYAIVSRDNEKVLRFIRRHDWHLVSANHSTMLFKLTNLTTRYPK